MTQNIQLNAPASGGATMIPNVFFDIYMPEANGDFVKVYLYLLRCFQSGSPSLSVSDMANFFDMTESDVIRAFRYWEKRGLLGISEDSSGSATDIFVIPPDSAASHNIRAAQTVIHDDLTKETVYLESPVSRPDSLGSSNSDPIENSPFDIDHIPGNISNDTTDISESIHSDRPAAFETVMPDKAADACGIPSGACTAAGDIIPDMTAMSEDSVNDYDENFSSSKSGAEILLVIEQYMGRPLSRADVERICYFHNKLGFSCELIDYLFDYCASNNKKDMRYIEKVAQGWYAHGIHTVEEAKLESELHQTSSYAIMTELGLGGRRPAPGEMEYIRTWTKAYGFSLELIQEACKRTVMTIHTPSFEYTDKILSTWKKDGISTMEQVQLADKKREETLAKRRKSEAPARTVQASHNRFNNFSQRSYDYSNMEKQLLGGARAQGMNDTYGK